MQEPPAISFWSKLSTTISATKIPSPPQNYLPQVEEWKTKFNAGVDTLADYVDRTWSSTKSQASTSLGESEFFSKMTFSLPTNIFSRNLPSQPLPTSSLPRGYSISSISTEYSEYDMPHYATSCTPPKCTSSETQTDPVIILDSSTIDNVLKERAEEIAKKMATHILTKSVESLVNFSYGAETLKEEKLPDEHLHKSSLPELPQPTLFTIMEPESPIATLPPTATTQPE